MGLGKRGGGGQGGIATLEARWPLATAQTLLWDGSAYPARDANYAYARFVGPTDPTTVGYTLADGDEWIDTSV